MVTFIIEAAVSESCSKRPQESTSWYLYTKRADFTHELMDENMLSTTTYKQKHVTQTCFHLSLFTCFCHVVSAQYLPSRLRKKKKKKKKLQSTDVRFAKVAFKTWLVQYSHDSLQYSGHV